MQRYSLDKVTKDPRKLAVLAVLLTIAVLASLFQNGEDADSTGDVVRVTKVSDGDTIRLGEERIRILGLDTPEVYSPGCAEEKALGDKATTRMKALIHSGQVTVERHGQDQYGRTLAVVRVDGKDVAPIMISEGLAAERKPKGGWCARLQ